MKERKPTQRELRTRAILRSDKTLITMLARALVWLGNAAAILWLGLFVIAAANKGDEGLVLLGIAAVPVLVFWLVARSLPRLVEWMIKDYP